MIENRIVWLVVFVFVFFLHILHIVVKFTVNTQSMSIILGNFDTFYSVITRNVLHKSKYISVY